MYTEKQLEKLITEVEAKFTAELAKAEENFRLAKSETESAPVEALAKAEEGDKKPEKKPEEKKPEEKAPEAKEGEKPAAEAPPAVEGEKPAAAEAAPVAPAQGEDHCDYDDEDRSHMEKMYMSMSKGELKAHHDCIAKLAKCGSGMAMKAEDPSAQAAVQKSELNAHSENAPAPKDSAKASNSEYDKNSGGKIEGSEPHNSPGAKSPASKADGVQMEKSENTEVELLKAEVMAANAKADAAQKNLDTVSQILTKMVEKKSAPQGKAITSLDAITKSEGFKEEEKSLSKNEIDAVLKKKSMDPKLEKSDRDLINNFYLGDRNINSISHLLK